MSVEFRLENHVCSSNIVNEALPAVRLSTLFITILKYTTDIGNSTFDTGKLLIEILEVSPILSLLLSDVYAVDTRPHSFVFRTNPD